MKLPARGVGCAVVVHLGNGYGPAVFVSEKIANFVEPDMTSPKFVPCY